MVAQEADEGEIFELSPFEVTEDSNIGYLATQTLAGTRIRTELSDVGSAISVITEEFMEDIGATDTSTLLQYTTNAEVAGTRGTYAGLGNGTNLDESSNLRSPAGAQRVRGLAAADNTRDFYITDIPWDNYNVSRIDIQRGPNSILFGLGSPAGILNASMDKAQYADFNEVTLRFGSYGSYRGTVDFNRELIDNVLAVRIEGLWDHEDFQQKPAFEDDERIYATFRWDPELFEGTSHRTTIEFNYEKGDITANRPRITPPNDSITPWFAPSGSSWTATSGMGKAFITNPYDVQRQDTENYPSGDKTYGMNISASPNYQPWLGGVVNQQQPLYFVDGASGDTSQVLAGYFNVGARNPDGSLRGPGDGLLGKQYAEQFFRLRSFSDYALSAGLPGAASGQYRSSSLKDPTVFDFYNNLIDGPNKWENEEWDAYSANLTQTFFDDRLAVQLTYDSQEYNQSSDSMLGGWTSITMDLTKNFQDFYTSGADGVTSQTNPNFGRPYVTSNAGGEGQSFTSDRKNWRASVFGELRASDIFDSGSFIEQLLGKHRFNGVVAKEEITTERRSWYNLANSLAWTSKWTGTNGMGTPYWERPPVGVIYLGPSIASMSSASGAYIPGIASPITFADGPARIFDPIWTAASSVDPADSWTVPGSLGKVFVTEPDAGWTQASNPANYTGWTNEQLTLQRYNGGEDLSMLKSAEKAFREVKTKAVSWQGYWWNDSLVTTVGWRQDEVGDKDDQAIANQSNRAILDISPSAYFLPDNFEQMISEESVSYGAVLHLNKLFGDRDPLPFNVSVSYNQSENFQVPKGIRRDVYGQTVGMPSGETEDYGILLSTKDGKWSFRMTKYETSAVNASSILGDNSGIGRTIQQGLRFRNVFLYDLAGYTWDTREAPSYRNTWTNPYPNSPNPQAEEDAAVQAWNDIQEWLTDKGFFEAWNFEPVPLQYLTVRSVYEATLDNSVPANPSAQYLPPAGTVTTYAAVEPQGFTVTEDTVSKGYEFELTANPSPNWRISFNASKTEAIRNNVGGANLSEMVDYLDSMFLDASGNLKPAALLTQWGNAGLTVYQNVYVPWKAQYTQMKLNEGTATPEIREWRFNLVTNYQFTDGILEGTGVGASYRWQDEVGIGYPIVGSGNVYSFDVMNPIYGPSEDAIDLWFSYETEITDRINWKIQLNIRNAFADEGLIPISVQADGTTIAGVRIQPVQEWFITNTFTF